VERKTPPGETKLRPSKNRQNLPRFTNLNDASSSPHLTTYKHHLPQCLPPFSKHSYTMAPLATMIAANGTTPNHQTYNIALIPGDGIGIEVIHAGQIVLQHLATHLKTFDLKFEEFEWSSAYYKKHGRYLPDDALEQVRKFDAILFGAVGAPGNSVPLLSQPLFNFSNVLNN
jgi:hypothetical protein